MLWKPCEVSDDSEAKERDEVTDATGTWVGRRPYAWVISVDEESDCREIGRTVAHWIVPVRTSSSSLKTCESAEDDGAVRRVRVTGRGRRLEVRVLREAGGESWRERRDRLTSAPVRLKCGSLCVAVPVIVG